MTSVETWRAGERKPTRLIAYIDGFNLYFGLKASGWKRYYWLNLRLLIEKLLKPGQALVHVKYFTARISAHPADPDKHKRQATWLEVVESLPDVRVYYGHDLEKKQQCFRCGYTWVSHEEKMTDVNIACALLRDAFEDRFDTALLLSADSDLAPPVEAVRAVSPAKRVIVVQPPARNSKKLTSVANASFTLGRKVLSDSQLPDEFTKPDGFVLRRPRTWK